MTNRFNIKTGWNRIFPKPNMFTISRPADRDPAALVKRGLFIVLALSIAFAGLHHFSHAHAAHEPGTAVTASASADASCCLERASSDTTVCLSACVGACSACVPITEHGRFDGRPVTGDFPAPAAVHPRSYRSAPFRPPRFT